MLAIEMLPAGHGDALVIEYGQGTSRHRLLIDAGTHHSWKEVGGRLRARKDSSYEVFVVTHVDEDHIGGAIALLDDPVLRDRINHIWFNGFVHIDSGSSVLGPVHGEQLTERIVNGPYRWNEPFPGGHARRAGGPAVVPTSDSKNADGSVGLPAFVLPGGARVVLLSPTGAKLKRMKSEWLKEVQKAGLVAGEGSSGHNKSPKPRAASADTEPTLVSRQRLEQLAATVERDGSAANGSSIAFVLEFGDKRLLLGADAHADVLVASLARYGQMIGEARPRIDVFKLPHHASGANVSNELISAMDCRRYLISTNGDSYDHPDNTAIARAVIGSAGPARFYCNYLSPRTAPWLKRGPPLGADFQIPQPDKPGVRVVV